MPGSFRPKNPDEVFKKRNARPVSADEARNLWDQRPIRCGTSETVDRAGDPSLGPRNLDFRREFDDLDAKMTAVEARTVVVLPGPPSDVGLAPPPASRPEPQRRPDRQRTPSPPLSGPCSPAKCAPCHEPGGKMYEKLPFDRAETIASHREGVLKRLKGDDREAVEKWLASLPPSK